MVWGHLGFLGKAESKSKSLALPVCTLHPRAWHREGSVAVNGSQQQLEAAQGGGQEPGVGWIRLHHVLLCDLGQSPSAL